MRAQAPERRPQILRWLAGAFALAFVLGAGLGLLQRPTASDASVLAQAPVETAALAPSLSERAALPEVGAQPPAAPAQAEPPPHRVVSGALERGETLAEALQIGGISADRIHTVVRELAPVFNFRYAKPGDRYRLVLTSEGDVESFRYERSIAEHYELVREGDQLVARAHRPEIVRRRARVAGVVATSLHEAVAQLGESRELAEDFAEIFAWDLDFSRSVRRGDEFSILYERLYIVDEQRRESYLRPGQILAARFRSAEQDYRAVYFEPSQGRGGYYRPDGTPVERSFLKAPVDYKRISSSYANSRLHPILGIRRPHHGIDYAAGYGTPVWSVGNGEVVYKGWQGGFGNLVKVQHANGYVSSYGHLSRFAQGLRVGQRIHQKQVVGYVGSTGLSTGPHLCFRLAKEGAYVNPATLRVASLSEPLSRSARQQFEAATGELLAALDPTPLVVTNEAL